MCIVFYTLSQPGYKLILGANRDEYLDRPAAPAGWHCFSASETLTSDKPSESRWVLSGVDLGSAIQGTWLGMTSDLRVGVLTNIRHPLTPPIPDAPSRGEMLKLFLRPKPDEAPSVSSYLEAYASKAKLYEGFNLLLFDVSREAPVVGYLSNRTEPPFCDVSDRMGFMGLSNSPLDAPWPKVMVGEASMEESLAEWTQSGGTEDELVERMMEILSPSRELTSLEDTKNCTCLKPLQVGPDVDIPTAQGHAGNRWYATRLSTVILIKDNGETTFIERDRFVLDEDGNAKASNAERKYKFSAVSR